MLLPAGGHSGSEGGIKKLEAGTGPLSVAPTVIQSRHPEPGIPASFLCDLHGKVSDLAARIRL
jgi:hypothetical protein